MNELYKSKLGTYIMTALSMGMLSGETMFSSDMRMYSRRERELQGIDIVAECKLIQQKKSRLSKRLRDEVVFRYESVKKEAQKR